MAESRAEVREQTGEGTLYDTNDNQLATSVAYRIVPGPVVGRFEETGDEEQTWGGEHVFGHEDEIVDPGLSVLATEDGTRVDIDIDPRSVADGDPRQVSFRGLGAFGERIV